MRRAVVVLAALTVGLAGCGWAQTDFDSGRSRANPLETKITAATVGSLERHSIPLPPSPSGVSAPTLRAVIGNQIITQQGDDVVTYDAATCPRTDGSACTPLWSRPGSRYWGGDGSHLVFGTAPLTTGDLGVEVTDGARNHLWDGDVPPLPADPSNLVAVALSGDKIVASVMGGSHGSFSEQVSVFTAAGCGAPTCGPLHTFANGAFGTGGRWVASGDTLVLNAAPSVTGGLHAFDMTTGAERWRATGDFDLTAARIRGSSLFVWKFPDTAISVYDLAGVAGCRGAPVTCSPTRTLDPADGLLYWESAVGDRVDALDGVTPNAGDGTAQHRLSFFAADGSGCTSTPCAPLATSAPVRTWANEGAMRPAVAGDLVLALAVPPGFTDRTYHLVAYDTHLTSGCGGTPKVCQPVADLPITGQSDAQPFITAVWSGRVYVQVTNGLVVFSLPGDVG